MKRRSTGLAAHLVKTWDFIERMERAPDAASVEDCLVELAGLFGFTAIFGGIVPAPQTPASEVPSRILIQRIPPDWKARYNGSGYVFRDPIVSHLQDARAPFSWDEAYSSCPIQANARLIDGEAREFGLRQGHVVPIPTLDGNIAAISFGGSKPEFSPEAKDALTFATGYAVGRLLHSARSSDQCHGRIRISAREVDCLLWAAEGKSDWEIAVILGISRSTVLKHIQSARDKLDAANRTHAVVKALRGQLIDRRLIDSPARKS